MRFDVQVGRYLSRQQIGKAEIGKLVTVCLQDVLLERDPPAPGPVEPSTRLIGPSAVLDSLGLVTLITDVEQRLEEEYDIALTLADDRAVSQRNSPFRSVQSLADYIALLIEEQQANDGA